VALLHAAKHLPAVDLRHHHVDQDQVGRLLVDRGEALVGPPSLPDGVALGLEMDAHVLSQRRVVVDDQDERAGPRLAAGARPLEERVEVAAPVPAVAARRVEGGHAAEVRPLADRALRDAEVLRRLAQGQPVGLVGRRAPGTCVPLVGHGP